MFWGGSAFISPFGKAVVEAHGQEEELLIHNIDSESLKRARIQTPLLRDERPHMVRSHLARFLDDPDAERGIQAQDNSPSS